MRSFARLALALLFAWVAAVPAHADDARPISFDVKEVSGGRYEVRFQTPMRGRAVLKVQPRLPAGSIVVPNSYSRQVAGDSSIERFEFTLEGGLVGREVGVDGLVLASRSAIVRVRLRDGRVLRAVLGGGRSAFRIEEPPPETRPAWTDVVSGAAREGWWHGLTLPAHVLLAIALVLAMRAGGLGVRARPLPRLRPPGCRAGFRRRHGGRPAGRAL